MAWSWCRRRLLRTVSEAEPAGLKSVAASRSPSTSSSIPKPAAARSIKASVLTFESEIRQRAMFAEVRLEKGSDASVLLLAPLLVRIPVN